MAYIHLFNILQTYKLMEIVGSRRLLPYWVWERMVGHKSRMTCYMNWIVTQYYELIFGRFVALNEIRHSIAHFMEYAAYEYWMTMPECGHLIASYYYVVLYFCATVSNVLATLIQPYTCYHPEGTCYWLREQQPLRTVKYNLQCVVIVNHV